MKYYSITEAAALIGVRRESLHRHWIAKGLVQIEKMLGRPAISADEIERIKVMRAARQAGGERE